MKLTVRDAARLLGVHEEKVHRWIATGELEAHEMDEQFRLNRAELLEWATTRGIPVSPDLFADDDESSALPTVASALARGGVRRGVPGGTKEETLRAVVRELPIPADVDREMLLAILLSREALGSTGIGDGIAIPHVRNPIVLHVNQPLVSVSFLDHPIEFGAIDGRPVHALFTLVTPTVRTHLHLLSRLAYLLRDGRFRQAVRDESDRDVLVALADIVESGVKGR